LNSDLFPGRNEAELLERLAHPNVAKFWACEVTKERAMMWMEFLSGGSVAHLIQSFGPLREDTASKFTGHALSALCYLHEHGVIHRDVKPSNLLVSSSGTVKLGDFGAAASLPEGNGDATMTGIAGTAQYMAPEMLRMNR
jgi:serine/threonine protein kinase